MNFLNVLCLSNNELTFQQFELPISFSRANLSCDPVGSSVSFARVCVILRHQLTYDSVVPEWVVWFPSRLLTDEDTWGGRRLVSLAAAAVPPAAAQDQRHRVRTRTYLQSEGNRHSVSQRAATIVCNSSIQFFVRCSSHPHGYGYRSCEMNLVKQCVSCTSCH